MFVQPSNQPLSNHCYWYSKFSKYISLRPAGKEKRKKIVSRIVKALQLRLVCLCNWPTDIFDKKFERSIDLTNQHQMQHSLWLTAQKSALLSRLNYD